MSDIYPIKNRQRRISRASALLCALSIVGAALPFVPGSFVEGIWALVALSVFAFVVFGVMAVIFGLRGAKMERLVSGADLIGAWQLSFDERELYADHLFFSKKGRNKLIFILIVVLMTLVFGLFILFIKDGRLGMFLFYIGVLAVAALFAFGMPYYYRWRNNRDDGYVLLGHNFAYVNGYFHNWDFPLSGLEKMEVIDEPFKGVLLQYYYVDRTLRHRETLMIPCGKASVREAIVKRS